MNGTRKQHQPAARNDRQVRRPEVARMAAELQRKHPRMSDADALCRAKAIVTSKGKAA